MSDFSQGPGWWQASDSKWYPPEQAAGAAVAAPPMGGDPYAQAGVGAPMAGDPYAQAQSPQDPYGQAPLGQTQYAQPGLGMAPAPVYGGAPAYAAPMGGVARGPVGKVREPLTVILLSIVTLGIYGIVWLYSTYKEMKDYSGQGIGGGVAILLDLLLVTSIVLIFLTPAYVGNLYAQEGQQKPVSGATGFWVLCPFIGGFVWLWKTQGRLNDFWVAHGATR